MNARLASLYAINQLIINHQSLAQNFHLYAEQLENPADKRLFHQIIYGTLRYYPSLEQTLNIYLKKKISQKNTDIKNIMMTAIYQLKFLNQPNYAVINESVNLANSIKKTWAKNLINAVLRQFCQQQTFIHDKMLDHPKWLFDRLKQSYPNHYQAICNINHLAADIMLRPHQISRDEYCNYLEKENITYQKHIDHKEAIVLIDPIEIKKLPLFNTGKITVQNANAQLAANLLNISDHMSILDACAAPGGKTAHISTKAKELKITTIDHHEKRSQRLKENLNRLNVQSTHFTADLIATNTWYQGQPFDRILLDAPCSGTGVIRKHPDILYLRTPKDIEQLVKTQKKLLETCWSLLKPGGLLLYATCSILDEENTEQVQLFLEKTTDAVLKKLGHNRSVLDKQTGMLQFIPDQFGDGFFYAALNKTVD